MLSSGLPGVYLFDIHVPETFDKGTTELHDCPICGGSGCEFHWCEDGKMAVRVWNCEVFSVPYRECVFHYGVFRFIRDYLILGPIRWFKGRHG